MVRSLVAGLLACAGMAMAAKPNVVLIMTDDQDMLLDSLSAMPNVMNLIGANGTLYNKHYCQVAWCCPSRVSFLTGMTAHNTNVTSLNLPYGGWPKFVQQGLNDNYLPVWINATGAHTYYLGKFMNAYSNTNFDTPFPNAWTNMSLLVDPATYNYFHGRWTNGYTSDITRYDNIHTTNVTQTKALEYLDNAAAANNQFFLAVAPVAPHDQVIGYTGIGTKPPPPEEFQDSFTDSIVPRSPNFNPDFPSGASWVYGLPQQSNATVQKNDLFYQARLQNLAGVDLMVAAIIQKLEDHNLLDNTYIIYTTDNGFHIGNHRLSPGKRCGYEEDINIPMLVRGPGVPANFTSGHVQSHVDLAPTILQMMGIPLPDSFDGAPFPITEAALTNATNTTESFGVEFWDSPGINPFDPNHDGDEAYTPGKYYNNTYKSLRLTSGNESFYYAVWCSGEHELYDMNADFYQLNNLVKSINGPLTNLTGSAATLQYFGRPINQLIARLDTLLLVTKSCKGVTCRNPYSVLFPSNESVYNLTTAMNEAYDSFFASQPSVQFNVCISGHLPEFEGPLFAQAFKSAGQRAVSISVNAAFCILAWVACFTLL